MDKKLHNITITVYDREAAFATVNNILHEFAPAMHLRVGYPVPTKNAAIIFLICEMTTDQAGAISGRLGQVKSVQVKTQTLKL